MVGCWTSFCASDLRLMNAHPRGEKPNAAASEELEVEKVLSRGCRKEPYSEDVQARSKLQWEIEWWEKPDSLERETGFEPATLALARRCSTTELFPLTHSQSEGGILLMREWSCQATSRFQGYCMKLSCPRRML